MYELTRRVDRAGILTNSGVIRPEFLTEIERTPEWGITRQAMLELGNTMVAPVVEMTESTPVQTRLPDLSHRFNLKCWSEMRIDFLSEERIQIWKGRKTLTQNYGEFGFMDLRSEKPNMAWLTLKYFAESGGVISGPIGELRGWQTVEKSVQAVRKTFQAIFGLKEDPVLFVSEKGYTTQFRIRCAASYGS